MSGREEGLVRARTACVVEDVKHIDLPDTLKRTMAQQSESERERRAKVIHAEGEFQAAGRLRDAAIVFEGHPMAMQMRFLQTLSDIGTEQKNTTIDVPLPLELLKVFGQTASVERPAQVSARRHVRAASGTTTT